MEKEIGPMRETKRGENGGVLKDRIRKRFVRGGNQTKGLLGNLRTASILAFILLVWVAAIQFVAAEKYDIAVRVTGENEESDFGATGEGLDYGPLLSGDSSVRFVTIRNKGSRDAYIKTYAWGAASGFLEVSRDGFILEAGKSENLEFTIKAPSREKEKEYAGRAVIFKIPSLF